jgi:hypothetical protein
MEENNWLEQGLGQPETTMWRDALNLRFFFFHETPKLQVTRGTRQFCSGFSALVKESFAEAFVLSLLY